MSKGDDKMTEVTKKIKTPVSRIIIGHTNLLKALVVCRESEIKVEVGMGESLSRFGFDLPTEYLFWFEDRHTAVMFDKALSLSRVTGEIGLFERAHAQA